ncbi:hypothetical protein EJB05_28433, partial [Eragrostis curvula]
MEKKVVMVNIWVCVHLKRQTVLARPLPQFTKTATPVMAYERIHERTDQTRSVAVQHRYL